MLRKMKIRIPDGWNMFLKEYCYLLSSVFALCLVLCSFYKFTSLFNLVCYCPLVPDELHTTHIQKRLW